jgi:hypothetical protein
MTERITIVEVDLDRCSLTYGAGACTASIPATGAIKCFNCYATCQDKTNYATETVTARYSTVSSQLSVTFDAIPNIASLEIRPAKLALGESIGVRASINISFKDSRYPDTGAEGDRYLVDRDYDPYTRGTYWGKFRARWPFVQGSDIRVIRGDTDQTIAQMETRHFIVDKVAGPDSGGSFTIQCKDALQLADGKKAQAPTLSNGATLSALNTTVTSLTLDTVGAGSEYPASGLAQIGGEEIVTFTRSGDVFTIVRAQFNTIANSHDEGSRVQLCTQYSQKTVTYIINDLLTNPAFANVPTSFIPLNDWTTEDNNYIARNYSAVIAEPTEVNKLINELLEQTASTIWWDDVSKLMRFRVLRAVPTDAALYDDNQILAGSFSAKDQPDKRVSRVWTYYGQINPLEKLDERKNYSSTLGTISVESEENFLGVSSIKRIYSRWIPAVGADAADRLNRLILSRYATPPRLIAFNLQRGLNLEPELGGGYNVNSWTIQDDTGYPKTLPIQVMQLKSSDTGFSVMGEEVLYNETVAPEDPAVKNIVITENENNVSLRNKFFEVFSVVNNGDTVNFSIEEGVIIGGTLAGQGSLLFGVWSESVTVNLVNNGFVGGLGGLGGDGGDIRLTSSTTFDVLDGVTGGTGQDAIILDAQATSATFSITNNGTIGGGGGGGGGSGAGAVYNIESSSVGNRLVGIGVSGAGGGGGTVRQSGGSAGYGDFGNSQSPTLGNNGNSSTDFVVGTGGAARSAAKDSDTCQSGVGGDGGQIGTSGQAGTNGSASSSSADIVKTSIGAAGGSAGNAINKSGQSVTITNNGTIAGAVIT